jgi:hypothetical protein
MQHQSKAFACAQKTFTLFANSVFLSLYSKDGKLDDKLCSEIANDLFKSCKKDSSTNQIKNVFAKHVRVLYCKESTGSTAEKDFIYKTIIGETPNCYTFLNEIVMQCIIEARKKPNWSYRAIVEFFGKFTLALALKLDEDTTIIEGEIVKISLRFPEELAKLALLKFAESQGD